MVKHNMGPALETSSHRQGWRRRAGEAGAERGYHEEGVNDDVEVERREGVARVLVVPEANLHRHDDGRVEQERRAAEEHPWLGAQRKMM